MARKPQKFGGAHTEEKLQHLEAYLKSYATALKNQKFRLIYFDAFAGTGDIEIGSEAPLIEGIDEYGPFIAGSAKRALSLGSAFDAYVFVEKSAKKARELERARDQHPDIADRVTIDNADANAALVEFCKSTDWRRTRAVVFLDPFGNQILWDTLKAIGETGAIDVWYLFPAGLGVHRQISRTGRVDALMALRSTNCWEPRNGGRHSLRSGQSPTSSMMDITCPRSQTLMRSRDT